MGNFIKLHEYIINLDNVDYIDTDYGDGTILIAFCTDKDLELDKTKTVKAKLKSLVDSNKEKDNSNE